MLFAVIRQEGASWRHGVPVREQELWDEHAAFMDDLFEEGLVVLAGLLGDGEPLHRALNIFDVDAASTVHAELEADPWTPAQMLTTVSVERRNVLIGHIPL